MKATFAPVFVLLAAALALPGCASNVPTVEYTQAPSADARIDANDAGRILVEAAPGVSMLEYEIQRLTQHIEPQVQTKKALNVQAGEPRDYEVQVEVTRYEKGNAFARAMLAGLGQIHLDADITLYRASPRETLGRFTVSKTFAWGGIYGGSTSMEDIEPVFAEGIAAALTGQGVEDAGQTTPVDREAR